MNNVYLRTESGQVELLKHPFYQFLTFILGKITADIYTIAYSNESFYV